MTEADWKAIAAIELAFVMLFCVLLASGMIPGTYGFIHWMRDNYKLAPWFSGAATTAGVLAALWNTNRQLSEQRSKDERERVRGRERTAEAAASVATVVALNVSTLRDILKTHTLLVQGPSLSRGLSIALKAMGRFPIEELPNRRSMSSWWKIEHFAQTIVENLDEFAEMDHATRKKNFDHYNGVIDAAMNFVDGNYKDLCTRLDVRVSEFSSSSALAKS